jgi:hypothetical protein
MKAKTTRFVSKVAPPETVPATDATPVPVKPVAVKKKAKPRTEAQKKEKSNLRIELKKSIIALNPDYRFTEDRKGKKKTKSNRKLKNTMIKYRNIFNEMSNARTLKTVA